ncbi:methylenetetrahydrofolate reductase [Thermogymnomonas acidicola]|uniref:Methylenetetrahydrofolate reductase n=1 Tax=Thermogymnomonas acidicola TaxID=399579 RepID=A0AA37BPF4_9ARCH|nr:methylenetetrahydrofolate reductase [Thermogymnomonas acidicola]GGM66091.1 methylenetetrahydrofolate reductase [Thermogymnomonas acidicola]
MMLKSVEIVPRKSPGLEDLMEAGRVLDGVADMVTVPENPMGLPGIDPILSLYVATRGTSLKPMPHITPRDKNGLQISAQVITGIKAGIDSFFVIGGDPISSQSESREVRELDVMGTIRRVKRSTVYMKDYEGSVTVGSSLNPYRDVEEQVVRAKREAGADFFITQAVYEPELLQKEWIRNRDFRLSLGFIPIRRESQLKSIEAMGVRLSEETKRKLSGSDPLAASRGILERLVEELRGYVDGVHIMPLGRNDIAREFLEVV